MSQTSVARLFENDRVGVSRMVSRPGDKGVIKPRPPRVLYVIKGSKVRVHEAGGKTEDAEWKSGEVLYMEADNRTVENVGTNDLEYISVHLK